MTYREVLAHRPFEVEEAYEALEHYTAEFGRDPLLLMMHASVPETLRPDLLSLINANFLSRHSIDLSLEADVLFSPLTTDLGGGYYRIDPQVRWHCLGLLRSLYRNDSRSRQCRVAELLWSYVESMQYKVSLGTDPLLAEYLAIQRWVAFAYLNPAQAAHAFAQALQAATDQSAITALVRFGGLASAIEIPLASEQELLAYAKGLDALVSGNEEKGRSIFQYLGNDALNVQGISLKSPQELLRQFSSTPIDDISSDQTRHINSTQKICFVIMGFGRKTDWRTSRVLDLEQTYEYIIKPAVEDAGLTCLRADEIIHSGIIVLSTFEQLLKADLVIADLSTSNLNPTYELGVRHALRPRGTIIIAEEQFSNPFDLSHNRIRRYRHDGISLDIKEVERFRQELKTDIIALIDAARVDSPVYTFLPRLIPPRLVEQKVKIEVEVEVEVEDNFIHNAQKTCFVIMGFGRKIDYHTGRELDLDKTYEYIIKPAVEDAGLTCLRADEIIHSDIIVLSTFEQLLKADLVIADLSTSNLDATYELGVRHALRPGGTIIIAEEQFSNPFDLSYISIRRYRHDGISLDIKEVERFRKELKTVITDILTFKGYDSPIYTFLQNLQPPEEAFGQNAIDAPATLLDKGEVLKILANSGGDQKSYLQGAVIGDINFDNHVFEEPAMFQGAHFLGEVNFAGAIFKQVADFSNSQFSKPVSFLNCRFEKGGNFSLARFQKVDFFQSIFHDSARFWRAYFFDEADFAQIKVIKDAVMPANYESEANWSWARFFGKATFSYAEFQHPVYFYRTLFKGDVLLEECRFDGPLILNGQQNAVLLPRFDLVNPATIARLESLGVASSDTERFRVFENQRLSEFVFLNKIRSEREFKEALNTIETITDKEKARLLAEWQDAAQPMFQQGRLLSFRNARFNALDRLDCQYVDFAKLNVNRDVCCSLEDRKAFENQLKAKSFDVFISHASEDKEAIARPLANKLSEMGFVVFLDDREIEIGSQLLQSLDGGISRSKYGVVIFSPAFIQKKWTKFELDGLLRLSQTRGKKFLPLWYGLNEAQVREWSESIANYVAYVVDKNNIVDVADKLSKVMG